jgi:hypothetical protein
MPALDATAAQKIVGALDAELARRRTKRDAVQDAAWEAEFGGDAIILLAKRLERDFDRRQKEKRLLVSPSPDAMGILRGICQELICACRTSEAP